MKCKIKLYSSLAVLGIFLLGCTTPSAITEQSKTIKSPAKWESRSTINTNNPAFVVNNAWLESFAQPALELLVEKALQSNYSLKAQKGKLAQAKERLTITQASDLPELSLSVNQARRKSITSQTTNYNNSADIHLQLQYEIDLWGKLSDEQAQAQLNYASELASYQHAEIELIAQVSKAWFSVLEANQLLSLYQLRASNLEKNLAIIQNSYQLGLSKALDVYLTQNDVSRELARVSQQQQIVDVNKRNLALLLGDYPSSQLMVKQHLPALIFEVDVGLPAQLLTQRADIKAAWFDLLSADAGLAIAHKQRFPRLSLSASGGDSSDELKRLLDSRALAWSLIGNLTMPLFNSGRLTSLAHQAKLVVEQTEQLYLQSVYQAFNQVENNLSNSRTLQLRFKHYQDAQDNAISAEKIAFDQYLKGLVSYTTVLESQRRAFDAQTSLIQIKAQLLNNRVDLFVSLGGQPLTSKQQANSANTSQAFSSL